MTWLRRMLANAVLELALRFLWASHRLHGLAYRLYRPALAPLAPLPEPDIPKRVPTPWPEKATQKP